MNNYMLYVFENLIKTTIVCSLGICLLLFLKRYLFKKFSKRFNYYIWLIIVFRMLLFLFNYTIVYEVKEPKENALGNNITQIDISTDNNLMLYVAYLWLFVTIVIAVYTFIKYTRFKNLVVDVSYDIEDNDINCIYKNLLKELNIKKKIELRGSDELISPAG
ncbi:protease, partial [Clostridioides difficile]|nr:protease [Clostridioides difficile]